MDPALLPDSSLLYVSPVPKITTSNSGSNRTSLYVQALRTKPRQLTFSAASVSSPTVLSDGRILFISSQPSAVGSARIGCCLYTINNDGTEISAFAGQHDQPISIQRPRQLEDGRIVFLVSDPDDSQVRKAECILSARPFCGRVPLLPHLPARICSVEPSPSGELLICAEPDPTANNSSRSFGVFRVSSTAIAVDGPVWLDPAWDTIESVSATASRRPMGRLSNVDLNRKTGQILCLDANNTTYGSDKNGHGTKASRIRIFTETAEGTRARLGEVELQADGSFMAEIPADIPLGFEALDEAGQVLRHAEPLIWIRPGENRSCIGCHEPHNHSPRNSRPLAVRVPVPQLLGQLSKLAQNGP
jgi:hypothetical protein